jgi:hypothetical protein
MDLPNAFAFAVIGFGAVASIAYAAWAAQWNRWNAPLLSFLDGLTAAWWLAVIGVYTYGLAADLDVSRVGAVTIRPLIAVLAILSSVRALVRYRRAVEREATRERAEVIFERERP